MLGHLTQCHYYIQPNRPIGKPINLDSISCFANGVDPDHLTPSETF